MGKVINTAIVGYGHLGKWHTQKVEALADSNLRAIVEPDKSKWDVIKEGHPHVEIVENIEKIVDEVEAFIVVAPTSFHYEISKYLIQNKKHVFCEKPLCSSFEQAQQLEKELGGQDDLIFQVGQSERFHKCWETLREKYREFLSEDCKIKITRVAPFKGRATDVDVVQDLMIHDLDLVHYLFDETPISWDAKGYKIRTKNWDHVEATFKFNSKREATLVSGRNHVKEIREVEIINDKGCLVFDLMNNSILLARGDSDLETFSYEKRDHLYIEQEHFYKSILNKSKPIVSLNDGLNAVKMVENVLNCLEEKCRV